MRKHLEKIALVLLMAILVVSLVGTLLLANPPQDDPDPDDPINKPHSAGVTGWLDETGVCHLDYSLNCNVANF